MDKSPLDKNMRPKIILYIVLTFSLTSIAVGQTACDTIKYPKLLDNSFHCKWAFFKLDKSIEGIIIDHHKADGSCGTSAFASLTIIKTDSDTIRVLSLCNENLYLVGQKVIVQSQNEPSFQVHLPFTHIIGSATKNKKKKNKESSKAIVDTINFDKLIIKTTWGQIAIL